LADIEQAAAEPSLPFFIEREPGIASRSCRGKPPGRQPPYREAATHRWPRLPRRVAWLPQSPDHDPARRARAQEHHFHRSGRWDRARRRPAADAAPIIFRSQFRNDRL